MRNVIAQRAGAALDGCYAGPHRDKRIARDLGVSVRMAQHLRAGQHWTIDRLAQASALIGAAFDRALYVPTPSAQHHTEMSEIADRLARLEARFEEVARRDDAGSAPAQSREADRKGRTLRQGGAADSRGGPLA